MKKKEDNKKINYFKFVWIAGIFAILILVLVIVIEYKVYYEQAINYIYFYDCNNSVCYTNKKNNIQKTTIYSKYEYEGTIPRVEILSNNLTIINDNTLYNYITGSLITKDYDEYIEISNYLIVSKNNLYGVIDSTGKIVLPISHKSITSNDGIYFTTSIDKINYNLIDINNNTILDNYDYIYEYNNVVVTVKDMKVSIKDIDGNDLIGRELEVYDKDRLINVTNNNNILYIRIYKNDKYYKYSYDINDKNLEPMST